MQQLTKGLVAGALLGAAFGCGKGEEPPVPSSIPAGQRATVDQAESMRPQKTPGSADAGK